MTLNNLILLNSQVKKTGDDVLDFIRFELAMRQVDSGLIQEVKTQPLPSALAGHLQGRVAFMACYANTFEAMKKLKGVGCKYVLGYWHHIIPVEHCFLKVGDTFHDPTGEILFEDNDPRRYFALFEMDYAEVRQHLKNHAEFPGIYEYLHRTRYKLAA